MQNWVKISVITIARWHIFDFARSLSRCHTLRQFMTAFPGARRYGIHARKMYTCWKMNYYMTQMLNMLPIIGSTKSRFSVQAKVFENYVKKYMETEKELPNIVVTNIGSADSIIPYLKQNGTKICLEYGSTRIENQDELLCEEYTRWGKKHYPSKEKVLSYKEIVNQADLVCVPSIFVWNSFVKYGFDMKKFFLNRYWVNTDIFHRDWEKCEEKFILINAWSQELRKWTLYTLQAWEKLSLRNAELRIVGNVLQDIRDLIGHYKGNETIKFIGSKPQRTLTKYFSYASCFISSSIEEGLAVTQLQAMACWLPLISNINSWGEDCVIEWHNGRMAKARDVDDIAEKIQRMYDHRDECREMWDHAAAYIQKEHSRDGYAQRAYEKYLTLL